MDITALLHSGDRALAEIYRSRDPEATDRIDEVKNERLSHMKAATLRRRNARRRF
jgi:hypothetical protein